MTEEHKHVWLDKDSDAYICTSYDEKDEYACVSLHDELRVARIQVTKATLDRFINILSELRLLMYRK